MPPPDKKKRKPEGTIDLSWMNPEERENTIRGYGLRQVGEYYRMPTEAEKVLATKPEVTKRFESPLDLSWMPEEEREATLRGLRKTTGMYGPPPVDVGESTVTEPSQPVPTTQMTPALRKKVESTHKRMDEVRMRLNQARAAKEHGGVGRFPDIEARLQAGVERAGRVAGQVGRGFRRLVFGTQGREQEKPLAEPRTRTQIIEDMVAEGEAELKALAQSLPADDPYRMAVMGTPETALAIEEEELEQHMRDIRISDSETNERMRERMVNTMTGKGAPDPATNIKNKALNNQIRQVAEGMGLDPEEVSQQLMDMASGMSEDSGAGPNDKIPGDPQDFMIYMQEAFGQDMLTEISERYNELDDDLQAQIRKVTEDRGMTSLEWVAFFTFLLFGNAQGAMSVALGSQKAGERRIEELEELRHKVKSEHGRTMTQMQGMMYRERGDVLRRMEERAYREAEYERKGVTEPIREFQVGRARELGKATGKAQAAAMGIIEPKETYSDEDIRGLISKLDSAVNQPIGEGERKAYMTIRREALKALAVKGKERQERMVLLAPKLASIVGE